jgi:DNA-binding NarL/FixJ family response regulator
MLNDHGETKPIRVMVVDDHEIVRAGVKVKLRGSHFVVIAEASNGKSAVEAAAAQCPDVILMDVRMPIMDGLTATRQIKSQLPAIKVLVCTSEKELLSDAQAAGADGFCIKDCSEETLYSAITAIHAGAAFRFWNGHKIS